MINNNYTPEQYFDMFVKCLESDTPIYNKKYGQLNIQDEEIFIQCYDPNIPERKDFPPYWFMSDKGNLVSMNNGKPYWICPYLHESTLCYKFFVHLPDGSVQNKSIQHHNLIGLIHGSERYGNAKQLIKDKGIYAFGINSSEQDKHNVQGHHKDGNRNNNKAENIEFVDDKVHIFMHAPDPDEDAPQEEEIEFMKKLSILARQEEPNAITVFFPGNEKYITTCDEITLGNGRIVTVDGKQYFFQKKE